LATQEDPFKLVVLSKGRQNAAVSNANFFFGLDGQLSFIAAGEDGVLRAFEFLPHREFSQCWNMSVSLLSTSDTASDNGKKLMLRTEFHGQSEHLLSLALPRRREGEDEDSNGAGITSAQSIVLYGMLPDSYQASCLR
jgi:cleavage and polyadenylation specificity factor subunit 1